MAGHIIIRSQVRDTLSDPMNQAALPTALCTAVQAVLTKANPDWDECDCGVMSFAIGWLACHNPNS